MITRIITIQEIERLWGLYIEIKNYKNPIEKKERNYIKQEIYIK